MATQAAKITYTDNSEVICLVLDSKSYDKVTLRCASTLAGNIKTIYEFGDGTFADDQTIALGASSTASRTIKDSAGTTVSLGAIHDSMVTSVFDYRLGKTFITFTPGSSASGTVFVEAITSKAGEK